MPTVLRYRGYRFFFFSQEHGEPIHIHVEKQEKYAKFWLHPVGVAKSRGFRDHELNAIARIKEQHMDLLEARWHEFFGC